VGSIPIARSRFFNQLTAVSIAWADKGNRKGNLGSKTDSWRQKVPRKSRASSSDVPVAHHVVGVPTKNLIPMAKVENRGMMRSNDCDLDPVPVPPRLAL
jgi:hypothetical protein